MALSAIGNRSQRQNFPQVKTFQPAKPTPLFDLKEYDDEYLISANMFQYSTEDDEELAFALQDSLDQHLRAKAYRNIEDSSPTKTSPSPSMAAGTTYKPTQPPSKLSVEERLFTGPSPTRLETALSIAGAGPPRPHHHPLPSGFGRPVLLSPSPNPGSLSQGKRDSTAVNLDILKSPSSKYLPVSERVQDAGHVSDSNEGLEEALSPFSASRVAVSSDDDMYMEEIAPEGTFNILPSSNQFDKIPSQIHRSSFWRSTAHDQHNPGPSPEPLFQALNEGEGDYSRLP